MLRYALFALLILAPFARAEVFEGGQIQEIYRVRLDRGDLLLESVVDIIQKYNIQDGAVLTAAGTLQECTFHAVKSIAAQAEEQFITKKGPIEILGLNGIIAAGEPHLHMTLGNPSGSTFGGHIEKGCKVLYRAELTIAKFSGTALARKPNAEGIPMMQKK
jgi:predicted DNA-binding protein with PD1-like motif